MNTPITFRGYQIESIDYCQNQELAKPNKQSKAQFEPEFEYSLNDEETKGIVKVTAKIQADSRSLKIVLVGFFDINQEYSDNIEQLKQYLVVNGGAIVLPYVRSIASMVTSLDSSESIILPTVNILEILEKKNEEKDFSE